MWRGGSRNPQDDIDRVYSKMAFESSLRFVNGVGEKCFDSCVNDFSTTILTSDEELCITRCSRKFTSFSQRFQRQWAGEFDEYVARRRSNG